MKIFNTKEEALREFPELKNDINLISDKRKVIVGAFDLDNFKTQKQNSLFHELLGVFEDSKCHSFRDYNDMREHYKDIAGLIQYTIRSNLKQETKRILYKVISVISNDLIDENEKKEIYSRLKGVVQKELSWSSVKRDNATRAIGALLEDMDNAKVIGSSQGKKYENILRQLNLWFEDVIG